MKSKIVIAIDGYASTGKSTVAKLLAKKLNYIYIDSGAMYRAVTLFAIENNMIDNGKVIAEKLIKSLKNVDVSFKLNSALGYSEVYLNNNNVENKIRTLAVSNHVSEVAAISKVRKMLVKQQQLMGVNKGIVMDGRDIGTVVFPLAELKLFFTAKPGIRAKRRHKELLERGHNVSYDKVYHNLVERDKIDTMRKDSPLKKAKDAYVIDNSHLTVDAQLQTILELLKTRA